MEQLWPKQPGNRAPAVLRLHRPSPPRAARASRHRPPSDSAARSVAERSEGQELALRSSVPSSSPRVMASMCSRRLASGRTALCTSRFRSIVQESSTGRAASPCTAGSDSTSRSGDFPHADPAVLARHTRWAGMPHVQWAANRACTQHQRRMATRRRDVRVHRPAVLVARTRSSGTLDPDDAPIHPPVAYTSAGAPLVIPRVDTPEIGDKPWLGSARLAHPHDHRYDITEWVPDLSADGEPITPPIGSAAVSSQNSL